MSWPNKVLVVAPSVASISPVTAKSLPVVRLIRMKASKAAKAPPARSFAQDPPMATAKRMCRLTMTAQPKSSMTPAVVSNNWKSPENIAIILPILIIKPAAGMTAITTIKALPNFCQKSNVNIFFILNLLSKFIGAIDCNVYDLKYRPYPEIMQAFYSRGILFF
ncbi:hypothetical protein SDC9_77659 [bioreactor metagenome]|uniref:Uncharacterized protein n=1 Tax=bioreactor metagenome TaxID=1076179 RepID=A0A644YRG3_9ZZZZ